MKSLICLVLSVHVLVLSVLPCTETSPYTRQADQLTQLRAANPLTADSAPADDSCTPFCSCSACPASATVPPVLKLAIEPVISHRPILANRFAYLPAHPITPLLPIWQPPQLV